MKAFTIHFSALLLLGLLLSEISEALCWKGELQMFIIVVSEAYTYTNVNSRRAEDTTKAKNVHTPLIFNEGSLNNLWVFVNVGPLCHHFTFGGPLDGLLKVDLVEGYQGIGNNGQ